MTHHRTCIPAKVTNGIPDENGSVDSGKQQGDNGNLAVTVGCSEAAGKRTKVERVTSTASIEEAIFEADLGAIV